MTDVKIDAKDVEALLFTAGAVSANGSIIRTLRTDQQFASVAHRIPDVVQRVGDLWRGAMRAEQHPERFADPTPMELGYLIHLYEIGAATAHGVSEDRALATPRNLITNGFVDVAVYEASYAWTKGVVKEKPTERRVKLTDRGFQFVMESRERSWATAEMERRREIAEDIMEDRKLPWWRRRLSWGRVVYIPVVLPRDREDEGTL